jgi:excisionase family DNA binding protein
MEKTKNFSPLLIGVADAATLLGVSRRTVQNLIFNKKLAVRKIGRRTLIPYSALAQLARRDVPCISGREANREADHD